LYLQGKADLLKEGVARCRIILCETLQVFHGTCLSGLDGDIVDHENHDTVILDPYESDIDVDSDTDYSDYDV